MADLRTPTLFNQALIGQQGRLLKLTTPLGEDVLLPQRVFAHERLSRGYDYTIDLLSVRSDIELKELIAQPVTLWIHQNELDYSPINGYVHTVKRLGSDGQLTFCQISFSSWLHFLKFRKDARIWQDRRTDDILAEVFDGHPQARGNFRFDFSEPVSLRSYCTQYETDWNFVQRLMEEEGWYSYHEQKEDGSNHVLVITDTTHHLKPVFSREIEFHSGATDDQVQKILQWGASRHLAPTRLVTRTDNYKAPRYQKQSDSSVLPAHGNLPSQLEMYEYTGAYTYLKREQGDKQSRNRIEEWESSMKRFYGVSGMRSLPVGRWFKLKNHPAHRNTPERDLEFTVIAIEWCIENNFSLSHKLGEYPGNLTQHMAAFKSAIGRNVGQTHGSQIDSSGSENTGLCFNRFEVQRRKIPFRSPCEHSRPELHPQTAVVVGPAGQEVYTDYLNRVKVQFRWDRENPGDERASCWVRVSYPNAGQGWGSVNVPRIGQEVIITFLGGNADRPVVTGRLYNEVQSPQWHSSGQFSGCKSKELNGNGFNQLVFDDTTNQNRIHLYSTKANSQLNLGYLTTQRGNERGRFYGSGFSLSTDDFGAIVTNKGLYISTHGRVGAQGTQLDVAEATGQLKAGASLTKTLSELAFRASAEPLAGVDALNHFVDATADHYAGEGQKDANCFKEPLLLAASPSGIGLVSTKGTHVHAGTEITLSSGMDANVAVGKSLLASVAEKISLFAANAGIKLFSAKGKIEVQAQSNDIDIIAEKVLRLLSTTSRIEIHAKEEVMISAGGSSIKVNSSGIISSTSGKWAAHASLHTMPGPATSSYVMPHLAKVDLQKTELEFRHLTDWGVPLAGAAYEAILSDGSVRKGTLDGEGIARISDVPPGASAKIEYDYKPMQAEGFVA